MRKKTENGEEKVQSLDCFRTPRYHVCNAGCAGNAAVFWKAGRCTNTLHRHSVVAEASLSHNVAAYQRRVASSVHETEQDK